MDNIMTPKGVAIAALRLAAEQEMGLWDIKDALHGAINDQAWGIMWDGMQHVPPSVDYQGRMKEAADWIDEHVTE